MFAELVIDLARSFAITAGAGLGMSHFVLSHAQKNATAAEPIETIRDGDFLRVTVHGGSTYFVRSRSDCPVSDILRLNVGRGDRPHVILTGPARSWKTTRAMPEDSFYYQIQRNEPDRMVHVTATLEGDHTTAGQEEISIIGIPLKPLSDEQGRRLWRSTYGAVIGTLPLSFLLNLNEASAGPMIANSVFSLMGAATYLTWLREPIHENHWERLFLSGWLASLPALIRFSLNL